MKGVSVLLVISLTSLLVGCSFGSEQSLVSNKTMTDQDFFNKVMMAEPLLPKQLEPIECEPKADGAKFHEHKTANQVNYQQRDWPNRVAADWDYFSIPASQGKLLIIDYKKDGNELAYRYLSNGTQTDLYEPWSSSKIQAFTGAVAKVRSESLQLGTHIYAGDTPLADLITSINSYEAFGKADGNSNAIASYFINVAGRGYLTALFEDWLNLTDDRLLFNGAYASEVYQPSDDFWQDKINSKYRKKIDHYVNNQDDPAYLPYRCDKCGLTGNKAMTTLAQAEWLKRLASHDREVTTQMPHLQRADIQVLFNGVGHSDENSNIGGMMLGISQIITNALARSLAPDDTRTANEVLDELTQGQWRVWQKVGWGPSETRSATETVMLAHVCLANYQGGREFTISAQNALAGADEANLPLVGKQMQANLEYAFTKLLSESNTQLSSNYP